LNPCFSRSLHRAMQSDIKHSSRHNGGALWLVVRKNKKAGAHTCRLRCPKRLHSLLVGFAQGQIALRAGVAGSESQRRSNEGDGFEVPLFARYIVGRCITSLLRPLLWRKPPRRAAPPLLPALLRHGLPCPNFSRFGTDLRLFMIVSKWRKAALTANSTRLNYY
jgi:hypothetical protein